MNFEIQGKINKLRVLIRKVGSQLGEDEAFLKQYENEQVTAWSKNLADLENAIACFEDLLLQACFSVKNRK